MAAFSDLKLGELLAVYPLEVVDGNRRVDYWLERVSTGEKICLTDPFFPTVADFVNPIGGTQYYREVWSVAVAALRPHPESELEPRYSGVAIRDLFGLRLITHLWFVYDDYYFVNKPHKGFLTLPADKRPKLRPITEILHLLFDPNVMVDEQRFRIALMFEVRPRIPTGGSDGQSSGPHTT